MLSNANEAAVPRTRVPSVPPRACPARPADAATTPHPTHLTEKLPQRTLGALASGVHCDDVLGDLVANIPDSLRHAARGARKRRTLREGRSACLALQEGRQCQDSTGATQFSPLVRRPGNTGCNDRPVRPSWVGVRPHRAPLCVDEHALGQLHLLPDGAQQAVNHARDGRPVSRCPRVQLVTWDLCNGHAGGRRQQDGLCHGSSGFAKGRVAGDKVCFAAQLRQGQT